MLRKIHAYMPVRRSQYSHKPSGIAAHERSIVRK